MGSGDGGQGDLTLSLGDSACLRSSEDPLVVSRDPSMLSNEVEQLLPSGPSKSRGEDSNGSVLINRGSDFLAAGSSSGITCPAFLIGKLASS